MAAPAPARWPGCRFSQRPGACAEVVDPGWQGVEPPQRIQHPDGGYGLRLVEHLSDGWGREATATGGSLAWFELDVDGLEKS